MKQFKIRHQFFDTVDHFDESNPPSWLVSKAFNWWYTDYVLKLEVGKSIKSDFQEIIRLT